MGQNKHKDNEVGGWLLFFIITLVIFSPLLTIDTIITQIEILGFVEIIESVAVISLFILTGIFLWRKKPYALKLAKVFLLTQLILNIVSAFLFSDFYSSISPSIYFVIWILYLYSSKRVKQVYGKLQEKSSGIQIWPIFAIIYSLIAPTFGAVFAIIALINIVKNRTLKGLVLSIIALIISILCLAALFGYGAFIGETFDEGTEETFTLEREKNSEELLNLTHGNFEMSKITFIPFYNLIYTEYESENLTKLGEPKLGWVDNYYEYENDSDFCIKRSIMNFTTGTNSTFEFNYLDQHFSYEVNLFEEVYDYSTGIKENVCYFQRNGSENDYIEAYFKDVYNNKFVEALSSDFVELNNFSNDEKVEIASLFVQSIPYWNDEGLNRYPYETIYEGRGNCLDKSTILGGLLKELNYTSYIIFGVSNETNHAIVGIACDNGNIEYEGKEICFIESTIISPIGDENDIEIDGYVKISNGSNIYHAKNYGKRLAELLRTKYKKIDEIYSQREKVGEELLSLHEKMCATDCLDCNSLDSDILYCDDADTYNLYVFDYNRNLKSFNLLTEQLKETYYDTNKLLFGNLFNMNQNSFGQRKYNEEFPLETYAELTLLSEEIHRLINTERKRLGLSDLGYNSKMATFSRTHSLDMANNGHFSYNDSKGIDILVNAYKEGITCEEKFAPLVANIFHTPAYASFKSDGYDWLNINELAAVVFGGLLSNTEAKQKIIEPKQDFEGIGVAVSDDYEVYITQLIC